MTPPIANFSGEYRWLSNFWPNQLGKLLMRLRDELRGTS